jgi:hypothetical protein
MKKSLNEELNSLPAYKAKCCKNCGRSYPETLLNIEGHIHYNMPYKCIDTVTCNQVRIENLRLYLKKVKK